MHTPNPNRIFDATANWPIRHKIDWERWKAVVFETDDWGSCETAANSEDAKKVSELWSRFYNSKRVVSGSLESPADLERLYKTLEQHKGADGLPAVFTAFMCCGNPDFEAIRKNNFTKFVWMGVDKGVPQRWERGDLVAAWRDGVRRGVFLPEFHGFLHHTSPKSWMNLLHARTPAGEFARELFELDTFIQGRHVPEYEGMNVREQNHFVEMGVAAFTNAVGYAPAASVTSDAFPVTETIWALNNLRIVCLKNSKMNSGTVVVYHTKPWNNQNPYVPIGAYDAMNDMILLTRNVWFEDNPVEETYPVVLQRWKEGEPAMISTHRSNYVAFSCERADAGYAKLDDLLGRLSAAGARYLSTTEVGDLYRQGWSLRDCSAIKILRKWVENAAPIVLPEGFRSLTNVGTRETIPVGADALASLPMGDYILD